MSGLEVLTAISDGVIYDKNGTVLAKGSTTCLIFRPKG